ncbi:hypothetical protein SAMD00019534_057560 [Acytostelium subglobosum LB1]|uniref:hypothetical protein n=1 Tax=Acytostelium subglobosum LB1 TaxID=1410327 RepID=UPI000644FD37|nr:hypothetical protein SAMD00019534_057560 [Acytostelium subglobosum LB1]GAM22581.1 hypothetical protein SAMD00019534_057560 [Acytostelium subglobosum LB1]|eukprot:XP_012754701.1 hypothetical protein SAMD00019534_057560 [Acytostelium subglobosum LB1]
MNTYIDSNYNNNNNDINNNNINNNINNNNNNNNEKQITIYHDNLQVILHNEDLQKIVLWDPHSLSAVVKDSPANVHIETKKIGSGGFGAVYHCRHLINTVDLGEYAVKKVPVGENLPWLYQVLQEVKALETLQKHKNIINYKHSWLEYDQPANFGPKIPCLFILMEYANNGNLYDYMAEKQILPENEIWSFFIDLCQGIGYLHHSEIIHRDLKPQNILLHQHYEPACDSLVTHLMISDFGTCDTVSGFKERLKRTGNTGTMEYVAPELLQKNSNGEYFVKSNEKCDIWSLGILLYELAYGRLPFRYSGNPFSDSDPDRNIDLLATEIEEFKDTKLFLPTTPPRSKEIKETIIALLRRSPYDRPSINQILATPFVQMKTKLLSIHPINIVRESPSIRKATIRKRNLKKSKEVLVEQMDTYDTDIYTNQTTSTSTTSSMSSSQLGRSDDHIIRSEELASPLVPPISSSSLVIRTTHQHQQHQQHQQQHQPPRSPSSSSMPAHMGELSPRSQLQLQIGGNDMPHAGGHKPNKPNKPNKPLSDAQIFYYIVHTAILLFQVWTLLDQCLPDGIPNASLMYPTLFISVLPLFFNRKQRVALTTVFTIRVLWFVVMTTLLPNNGCQLLNNDGNKGTQTEMETTTPSRSSNIGYSLLTYFVSLISLIT